VVGLIVVLAIAGALIIGAFARLVALRRQWRNEPPPTYSRPYQRWKDEDKDR
jgi:uncharacterized protein YneF (UPF0154 family)